MHSDYPFVLPPAVGATIPVAPGVLWLRMPLPFALDHINLWLIEDGDGWALVDTGFGDARTRAVWQTVFATVMGGRPITRLISTHFHPDHMGLAAWLQTHFDVPLEATLAEWLLGRMLSLDGGQSATDASLRFYRSAGAGDALLETVVRRGNSYKSSVDGIPAAFTRISEGQSLTLGGREWRIVIGRGHSPEMACLVCDDLGLLISGDQVLPAISPNVSVWASEPEANPLALFLASLQSFQALPADLLVLPSHGLPFRGLHHRIDVLESHHHDRLAETLDAASVPLTAAGLLNVLFPRSLDNHQIFFAMGESIAHLAYLCEMGLMARETDANGVHYYRRR